MVPLIGLYRLVFSAGVNLFDWIAVSVLYITSISVTWAPGDVTSYVEFLKNLQLSSAIWFPVKATCAFPLVYHYINGIRHLVYISATSATILCTV